MNTFQIKFLLIAFLALSATIVSCNKEDDPDDQPPADALVLDCDYQGLDKLVHEDSVLVLNDRGAGVDYIINCVADIEGELIIEPGVTIQFGPNGALDVNYGSVTAVGTPTQPIVFTGEDKVPGAWGYVVIKTDDPKNRFEFCTFEYGGGFQVSSNGDTGNLIFLSNTRGSVDNCTFTHSQTFGVRIYNSELNLTSFSNNTFNNNNIPLHIPASLVRDIDGGDFVGNTNDYVLVQDAGNGNSSVIAANESHTWPTLNVPYRIGKTVRVTSGTLILSPGSILEFENGKSIDVGDSDDATLIAKGTASEVITFTGANKTPGAWGGIYFSFTESPLNEISHAVIEYTGAGNGAITMWADPVVKVENVSISNTNTCAFYDSPKQDFNPASQVVNPNLIMINVTYSGVDNSDGYTTEAGDDAYCYGG